MQNKNHYSTLGVDSKATRDEIRSVYRKLAREYHPDTRNPSLNKEEADEMFRRASEAYDVLQSDELRAAYDRSVEHPDDGVGVNTEGSSIKFNARVSKAEAEAMKFAREAFAKSFSSQDEDDDFGNFKGEFCSFNFKKFADNKGFARSYKFKIGNEWKDLETEKGQVWDVLRQWISLMENLIYKAELYKKEGSYTGDYGDIETAFENFNLFLFSRSYLATIGWLSQISSNEGVASGFAELSELVDVCKYAITDFDLIREAQLYYAEHKSEMPVPPADPYKNIGEDDRRDEVSRSRIVFGGVEGVESSDGINIPSQEGHPSRIVWGDNSQNIRWGLEVEGKIKWSVTESSTSSREGFSQKIVWRI